MAIRKALTTTSSAFRDRVRANGLDDSSWFAALDSHDEPPLLTEAEAGDLVAGVGPSEWLAVLLGNAMELLVDLGSSETVMRWAEQDYLLALTLFSRDSVGLADMVPNLFVSPPGELLASPSPFRWPRGNLGRRVEQIHRAVAAIHGDAWGKNLVVFEDTPEGLPDSDVPERVYVAFTGSSYIRRSLDKLGGANRLT